MRSRNFPHSFHNPSTDLSFAFLISALNFENASSIAFKSGLHGGKTTNLQPYASQAFQECLTQYGVVQSMSRHGNCYYNPSEKNFYKSFKLEEVYRRDYETHEEATRGVGIKLIDFTTASDCIHRWVM